jgi:hypothetical protein
MAGKAKTAGTSLVPGRLIPVVAPLQRATLRAARPSVVLGSGRLLSRIASPTAMAPISFVAVPVEKNDEP